MAMVSARGRGLGVALALVLALAWPSGPASGADSSLMFLTFKRGVQDPGGSGDTLIPALETSHGPLQGTRAVQTQGVELDVYSVASAAAGIAVGVEILEYDQTLRFAPVSPVQTPETLRLSAQSVLFTLKGFLRWGPLLPFVGIGSGNYYVKYRQDQEGLAFLDSAPEVLTARVGMRVMLGRLGLLAETGATAAKLRVQTQAGLSTLELGGSYTTAGLSWLW
jgi:hypothetical protein